MYRRSIKRAVFSLGLALAISGCATDEEIVAFGDQTEEELGAQRGDREDRDDRRGPRPGEDDREPPPAPEEQDAPEPIDGPVDGPVDGPDDDRPPPPDADEDDQAGEDGPPPRDGRRPPRDGDRPPPPDADDDDDQAEPPAPPADDDRPAPPAPPADEDDDRPEPPAPPADDDDDFAGPVGDPNFDAPLAPSPGDNPLTQDKVELGRLLYWDPILSGNLDVSCATCHHPEFGYADGLPLSVGVGGEGVGPGRIGNIRAGRNAPTVLNTGLNGWIDDDQLPNPNTAPMFWDVRARSLESQALGPIVNAEEMRGDAYSEEDALDVVVERLRDNETYAALFMDVFGGDVDQAVTEGNLARAIAAFERHLSRPNSAFDRWQAGDNGAMTAQQVRGFNTFNRIGCDDCHSGPMFSDFRLRRIGAPNHVANRGDAGDGQGRFRVPTLRNIIETGPYMHSGTLNLREVFAFYRRPGQVPPGADGVNPPPMGPLDRDVIGLRFNGQDEADMIAFLRALSDDGIDNAQPASVPSGLQVGGNL